MAIPVNAALALIALFASLCVAWECGEAVNETIQYYIPGQWDLYHKGELVKSDCSMDEATDYMMSDGSVEGRVCDEREWVFTEHGMPASDGFEVTNRPEYGRAWRSARRGLNKAWNKGLVTLEEYNHIKDEITEYGGESDEQSE